MKFLHNIFLGSGGSAGKSLLNFALQPCFAVRVKYKSDDYRFGSGVTVYDRQGETVSIIALEGNCTQLVWDNNGDILAILTDNNSVVTLWNSNNRTTKQLAVNVGAKDALTFAVWAKNSQILAIGSSKGNLLIYDHNSSSKTSIVGKHTSMITSGDFNEKDLLALGGEDQQITVSKLNGDLLYAFHCAGIPADLQFHDIKEDVSQNSNQSMISAIVAHQSLMLIQPHKPQNPVSLHFQARYGNIVQYRWYNDELIIIGFQFGYIVSISTQDSEIGQEMFSIQDQKNCLSGLTVSMAFGKLFTTGDSGLKVRNLSNLAEVHSIVNVDSDSSVFSGVEVTDDGVMVAANVDNRKLQIYLTRLPCLGAAYQTTVAYLSSLYEITVTCISNKDVCVKLNLTLEPKLVAVGCHHLGVAVNNRVWYYTVSPGGIELLTEKEYMTSLEKIEFSSRYVCLFGSGKLILEEINQVSNSEQDGAVIPDVLGEDEKIICFSLNEEFLVYGSSSNNIIFLSVAQLKQLSKYEHVAIIQMVRIETSGTRTVFVDVNKSVFIFNPVYDTIIEVPTSAGNITDVLWENWAPEKDIFVLIAKDLVEVAISYRDTLDESKLGSAGVVKIPSGRFPLLLSSGTLTCLNDNGYLVDIQLCYSEVSGNVKGKSQEELQDLLQKFISLKSKIYLSWLKAWDVCAATGSKDSWLALSKAALQHLNVSFALKVYREMKNVAVVRYLTEVKEYEDRDLLAGCIAMMLGMFDVAEKFFLESGSPERALEMRRELLQWEKALQLATQISPESIPFISKECAQDSEFSGDYQKALEYYESAMLAATQGLTPKAKEHNEACSAGIARTSIRLGEIRRGFQIAQESNNLNLMSECAVLLEETKNYNEAALLYEKGKYFDKAAAVLVKIKKWSRLEELLPKVHSFSIYAQYAKAMEAQRSYEKAVEAYTHAKSYENAARVLINFLKKPEEAAFLVKEHKCIEAAKTLSKFYLKKADYPSAVQFLVLADDYDEAFKLAVKHDQVEAYAETLGTNGQDEDYGRIAEFYEQKQNYCMSGKYLMQCKKYNEALDYLLRNGGNDESLELAVDCVGFAKDDRLQKKLILFLLGEVDGLPKEPRHIFRLYTVLNMPTEAAKTAVIIAQQEQRKGNYRKAHDLLFSMYSELTKRNIKAPQELQNNLMLVHSYLLIKSLTKRREDMAAARMLIRVVNNISLFPAHAVKILTSAVIQCYKVGLRKSAFNFCVMLMRPEYRKDIDEKYKRKIEHIVRKSNQALDTEVDENKSPCPFCGQAIPITSLMCDTCKSSIPYCIVTGNHVLKDDLCFCPSCNFVAIFREFTKLAEHKQACPMCGEVISTDQLEKMDVNAPIVQRCSTSRNE